MIKYKKRGVHMKRIFSKEFKAKACELVINDGIKPSIVAEKLAINVIMLYRWMSTRRLDQRCL